MTHPDPALALIDLEFKLLNCFQRGFPLLAHPFAALAKQLETTEASVIDHLQCLQERGLISRVGAVFRPNAIGASALAALAVPVDRLEDVASYISAIPEVNHNYEREHRFNLWFVVTASSAARLRAVLRDIEDVSQCGETLVLPLQEDYHIDLGFDLLARSDQKFSFATAPSSKTGLFPTAPFILSAAEQTLVAALQNGLPLIPRPFASLGLPEHESIAMIARWLDDGVIKRLGVVVRHHELGYRANAMAVWDVPDSVVSEIGQAIAATGQVTLCYRRPRQLPNWPYNLFCMIHGKDRTEVAARIGALAEICKLDPYPHAILFSRTRFKQCGARYAPIPEVAHG